MTENTTTPTDHLAALVAEGNSPDDAWQRALDVVLAARRGEQAPTLDGATEPGPENTYAADAGQFAARWNALTPEQRDTFVQGHNRNSELVIQCIASNHAGHIDHLEGLIPAYDMPTRITRIHQSLRGKPWPVKLDGSIDISRLISTIIEADESVNRR